MQEHFKSFISSQPPLSSPTSSFSICYRWQCDKFFHPSLPRAPSPSSILLLTFPSSPPHSLCLTSFLFISVSNSPQLPSLNRTVCLFDGLRLPLAALNLLSTARGVSIWRGFFRIDFYFFFAIVCKKWKCVKYSKHILYVESSYISIFKQTCR